MLARWSPLLLFALTACALHALPPVETPDVATLEHRFDEPWIVLERDLGEHALLEFASRAGSIEGGAPLVAAIVVEAMAARVGGSADVMPGLSLIRARSTPGKIIDEAERLLSALDRPLLDEEIEAAWARIVQLRRAQEAAHSRAAILAAFEALGLPEAIPLGAEGDALPDREALEAFRRTLAEPAHAKWIFVGELSERASRRLARLFDVDDSAYAAERGGAVKDGLDDEERAEEIAPLRRLTLPRDDRAKAVAGPSSWALVAALPRLDEARSIQRAIERRPPFDEASIGLAPSSAGAFLVISGEGTLSAHALRFMKAELIRLSRPLLPRQAASYRDPGEAIAGVALEFAGDARSGDLVLGLGVAAQDAEGSGASGDAALLKAFEGDPEFTSLPHEDFMGYGAAIAIRLKRALADEPRSEAGRTELALEALRRNCLERGLPVEIFSRGGDAIARLHLSGAPRFEDVDAFIQCFLREIPSGVTFEASRIALLRQLAADPYQDLLERLSAALSPSSPSIFLGVESKSVRDRGKTRALIEALAALRVGARIEAAVAGELAGAVAEQLGYALAALPQGERERPLAPSPIGELRSIAPIEGIPVMGVGVRLVIDPRDDLSAYLRALEDRLRASGVRVVRSERSARDDAGFIALIVALGGDDPVALRQRIEEALPDKAAIEEARIALEYESLLRDSGPAARALALLFEREGRGDTIPRVVGIIATLGAPELSP